MVVLNIQRGEPLNLIAMAKIVMFSDLGTRVQDEGLTLQPSSPLKISSVALICETWKETMCGVGGKEVGRGVDGGFWQWMGGLGGRQGAKRKDDIAISVHSRAKLIYRKVWSPTDQNYPPTIPPINCSCSLGGHLTRDEHTYFCCHGFHIKGQQWIYL